MGKAQIIFINIYYVLLGVMGLVVVTYFEVKIDRVGLAEYFVCESLGNSSNCQLDLESFKVFKGLAVSVKIMLFFLPVVALIFSFNLDACKKLRCAGARGGSRNSRPRLGSTHMYRVSNSNH